MVERGINFIQTHSGTERTLSWDHKQAAGRRQTMKAPIAIALLAILAFATFGAERTLFGTGAEWLGRE